MKTGVPYGTAMRTAFAKAVGAALEHTPLTVLVSQSLKRNVGIKRLPAWSVTRA